MTDLKTKLGDFRGKKDQERNSDKWFYDRARYLRVSMQGQAKLYGEC